MKVLVRQPALFDAEVVRRLPDGRVLVELRARRLAVEAEDVEPTLERQCEALGKWAMAEPGPSPDHG